MTSFGLQSNIRKYVDTLLDTINTKINDIYSQFNFIKIHSHKQIELLKNTLLTKIQNLALRITKVDNKFSMMEKAFDIPARYYSSYDIKNTGRSGPKKYNAVLNINVLPELYFPILQKLLVSNVSGDNPSNNNVFNNYIKNLIKNNDITTTADLLNTINNNQDQGEFIKKLFNNTVYFYHLMTDTSYKLDYEKITLSTPQTFNVNNKVDSTANVYKLKYVDSEEPVNYIGVSIQIPLIQESNNQLMLLYYDKQIDDKFNKNLDKFLDKDINKNIFSNNAISLSELEYLFNYKAIATNVSIVTTGKDKNHITISNLKSRVDITNMDDIFIPAELLENPKKFDDRAPQNTASINERYDYIKNYIILKNDTGKKIPLKKYNINHPISEEQYIIPFSNVEKK